MAARAPITINDGQVTPVAHTFKPTNVIDDVNFYVDNVSGIAAGFPVLSLSLREPTIMRNSGSSTPERMYKVLVKLDVPTLEVTSASTGTGIQPAPTRAYTRVFKGEFMLPERSMRQERKDLLAYAKNALAHAVVEAMVVDLEDVWG